MKKLSLEILFFFLLVNLTIFGQVGIGINTPDSSAVLDLQSSNKGFLLPRLTLAQIRAISTPANGLQVFCVTDSKMYIYVATLGQWKEVAYGTGAISPPFSCGIPITINHVAGSVAPVNKTVTYGTVTSIPGEPAKCWITSNLGADHQAAAIDDATEASAGWYWQFNRMQGYKHDGTTRTPNSAWITEINEDSDWQPANDPCTLELGSDWHVPTWTEWNNAHESGVWTDWNGPWNSALKIHAAGCLSYEDSMLNYRGMGGFYWSSTQNYDFGWYLFIYPSYCGMDFLFKAEGYTVRCIRD
jgi:hypothetical protein